MQTPCQQELLYQTIQKVLPMMQRGRELQQKIVQTRDLIDHLDPLNASYEVELMLIRGKGQNNPMPIALLPPIFQPNQIREALAGMAQRYLDGLYECLRLETESATKLMLHALKGTMDDATRANESLSVVGENCGSNARDGAADVSAQEPETP